MIKILANTFMFFTLFSLSYEMLHKTWSACKILDVYLKTQVKEEIRGNALMSNCLNHPGFTPRSRVGRMWSHCRTGSSSCGNQPGIMLITYSPVNETRKQNNHQQYTYKTIHLFPWYQHARLLWGHQNKPPLSLPYTTTIFSSRCLPNCRDRTRATVSIFPN